MTEDNPEDKELTEVLNQLEQALTRTEQNLSLSLKRLRKTEIEKEQDPAQVKEIVEMVESVGETLQSAINEIRAILKE